MEFLYGIFLGRWEPFWCYLSIFMFLVLGYKRVPLFIWCLYAYAILIGFKVSALIILIVTLFAIASLLKPLRRIFSKQLMMIFTKLGFVPKISETEKAALDAGTVWIEKDFFSGAPNFNKLMSKEYPAFTEEEKNFIDGPVEQLCLMLNDWKIWHDRKIPEEVWEFLKREKFFGMIVPKKYGGLELSAHAHSEVIMKLTTRSIPVAITAMVPNSLGPAELLTHYGTEEQKKYYLPRLARGDEIPCFALTEPEAGSDAGSLEAEGVLFKGQDGLLRLKLNWNKRWITLSGVSTLLGLAFRLKDPDHLISDVVDLGITCALIPANTEGVIKNRRHDPLNIPFINCPTQGKDVVVLAEMSIIGGLTNAGKGWRMLMECLAAGRGISLPAQAAAGAKLAARIVGAHAAVRKQFGIPIGKFEGVSEALAHIAGLTYMIDSLRNLTTLSLNQGAKPPVLTAITKYYTTENSRIVLNHAMDVLGGSGISRGPKNVISNHYMSAPVAITVEGANILTRTLIVFGQGLFRAHPYAYSFIKSLETSDVKAFDKAFWGQIGHVVDNSFRSPILSLSRGYLHFDCPRKNRRYFQKLNWSCASFAMTTNLAMMLYGPELKVKESLSGRFADILAWQCIGFSVLYRAAGQGFMKEDQVLVDWSMNYVFMKIQEGFEGIYENLEVPGLSWFFNKVLGTWVRINRIGRHPSDHLGRKLASILMTQNPSRDRLTQGIFIPKTVEDTFGRVEYALKMSILEANIEKKIRDAVRRKELPKGKKLEKLKNKAVELGIITQAEFEDLNKARQARWEAIQVDDFSDIEYFRS